jgi:hypothetical protein
VAEAGLGQVLAVGGGGEGDPGVGVQVVDVGGVHQAVHRGVDRRRRPALAVQAVVERGDHLVFPLDPGVDVGQRPEPVQPEHGQPGLGQRAQVTARALHPHQVDRFLGHGVGGRGLGRCVATRVIGVLRIGAQAVAPLEQRRDRGTRVCHFPKSLSSVSPCP